MPRPPTAGNTQKSLHQRGASRDRIRKRPALRGPSVDHRRDRDYIKSSLLPLATSTSKPALSLASARTRVDVNWEINDLLKTAGQQAASFLAQMQATEALLEARKFDAFNRMSAFVVHDLKNIVTQLSLMLKNAKRLGDNPEFQQDMLMTVENSLDRMRQLMLQLREGSITKPI